jgi:hypothetical protein
MPLTIRIPAYDETMPEIEDGGYVTMREAFDTTTPPTVPVSPEYLPPLAPATPPPPRTVFDELDFPPAPPVLVRQRAVALLPNEEDDYFNHFPNGPIRSLFGEPIPFGEPLEPIGAAPAPVGGFGPAPIAPTFYLEPTDRNNPFNPNRLANWDSNQYPWF